MKITVKKLPKSEVELTIEVPASVLEKYKKEVIKNLSQKKVDGFRAGKVPEKIILEKYGENYIKAETLEMTINETFFEAVKKEKIRALEMPRIEIKNHDPLVYVGTVSVIPEVEVPALKDIPVPKAKEIKISKKEIEESKKMFQDKFAEVKKQDRPVKKGDIVEIDFDGFDEDGVSLEGTQSKHHPVNIGSNTFIPGFEDNLIGLKEGDEKEFTLTFPADYGKKSFQNKKVLFKIKVHYVFEKFIPDFDEALVEKLTGQKKTVQELEKEIEDALTEKYKNDDRKRRENEFLEELAKKVKTEVPQVLIENELDGVIEQIKHNAERTRTPWENYLKNLNKTEEELRNELREKAEKNVLVRLAFQILMENQKPELDKKEIDARIAEIMQTVPADQKKAAEQYFAEGAEGWKEITGEMAVNKFFDNLFADK